MRVPGGVGGKYAAGKALGTGPLEHTRWAYAARIESIPMVFANTLPTALRLGRPVALWATDARLLRAVLAIVENFRFLIGLNNSSRQAEPAFACCAHIH